MTPEEIVAFQEDEKRFAATPLGAAFRRFEAAHARAWQLDTEDGERDGYPRTTTRKAWEEEQTARKALVTMLKEIAYA